MKWDVGLKRWKVMMRRKEEKVASKIRGGEYKSCILSLVLKSSVKEGTSLLESVWLIQRS